ncbi:hypothetical protein GGI07_005804 [Coemansia sp. Benny D115]|nr:hypothetical protein GGI07_005804 [Coemansia sp. Benny D115]
MSLAVLIPDDIMAKIIRYCVGPPCTDLYMWKTKFALLQVCSAWTRVAQPLVYSEAFFECYVRDSKALNNMHIAPLEGAPEDQKWVSNLDFIAQNGKQHMVRRLSLKLATSAGSTVFFGTVLEQLVRFSGEWPSIDSLIINMSRQFTQTTEDESEKETQVARQYARVMPNLTSIGADCGTDVHSHILGEIAGNYTKQLAHLALLDTVSIKNVAEFSPSLTSLTIRLGCPETQTLPRIPAHSLKRLAIRGAAEHFTWKHFEADSSAGRTLRFDKLEELNVFFSTDTVSQLPMQLCPQTQANGSWETQALKFPKLKRLFLGNCFMESCNLLLAKEYECPLERLQFNGSLGAARSLAESQFCEIESCHIEIISTDAGEAKNDPSEFYRTTNKLFGDCISAAKHAGLALHPLGFELDVDQLWWPHLTSLSLYQPIQFADLLKLIPALPRLDFLELGSVVLDGFFATESDYMDFQARIEADMNAPFDSRINVLSLCCAIGDCPVNVAATAAGYLMLRLTGLKELLVNYFFEEFLEMFADQFADDFEHLEDLSIKAIY